jgi:hypothetical protein
VKLPQELHSQVETIRADDLDILLVGSIATNAAQNIILLALHQRSYRLPIASLSLQESAISITTFPAVSTIALKTGKHLKRV